MLINILGEKKILMINEAFKNNTISTKAVILNEEKLLVQRHAHGHADLPGGRIHKAEDLFDALRRELTEELHCSNFTFDERPLFSWYWHNEHNDTGILGIAFRVIPKNLADLRNLEGEELVWVSKEELPELDFVGGHRPFYRKYLSEYMER